MPTLQPTHLAAGTPRGTPGPPRAAQAGSRRQRIWELSRHAHCPVIGVCLPMGTVRRLVDKVLCGKTVASDYELHCGVNTECKQRGPIAEAVQKELDRRYAVALRRTQVFKNREALVAWWHAQACGPDVPGALWATLTHPRCDAALEEAVLQDIHMIQHQNGAADRADVARLTALQEENEVLGRDTLLSTLDHDLRTLEAAVPSLLSRDELTRRVVEQTERTQDLERALLRARHDAERERHRADEALLELQQLRIDAAPEPAGPTLPVYRRLVEGVGGRFLHHDGGEEDNVNRLDSTLAAAGLVICQTGCISHNAYWRVKDHCKRTGKHCLFVENPSSASLRRALREWVPAPAPHDET